MRLLIFTTALHLAKEFTKDVEIFKNYVILDNFLLLEKEVSRGSEDVILIYHIQNAKSYKIVQKLFEKNPNLKAIALSNTPNTDEGCRYLAIGFKSYLHAFSNTHILQSAVMSVDDGNVYVYPELMNFLVSQLNNKNITFNAIEHIANTNTALEQLTPKELEVLELLSKGMSNMAIAQKLNVAEITVKKHISSMFEKLNVRDRLSLALLYNS